MAHGRRSFACFTIKCGSFFLLVRFFPFFPVLPFPVSLSLQPPHRPHNNVLQYLRCPHTSAHSTSTRPAPPQSMDYAVLLTRCLSLKRITPFLAVTLTQSLSPARSLSLARCLSLSLAHCPSLSHCLYEYSQPSVSHSLSLSLVVPLSPVVSLTRFLLAWHPRLNELHTHCQCGHHIHDRTAALVACNAVRCCAP